MEKKHYTYMVRCADDTLYTGWTTDLDKRLAAHNDGTGAKYTRPRRPVALAYYEVFATKEEAMRREWNIKQLPRKEKLKLVNRMQSEKDETGSESGSAIGSGDVAKHENVMAEASGQNE